MFPSDGEKSVGSDMASKRNVDFDSDDDMHLILSDSEEPIVIPSSSWKIPRTPDKVRDQITPSSVNSSRRPSVDEPIVIPSTPFNLPSIHITSTSCGSPPTAVEEVHKRLLRAWDGAELDISDNESVVIELTPEPEEEIDPDCCSPTFDLPTRSRPFNIKEEVDFDFFSPYRSPSNVLPPKSEEVDFRFFSPYRSPSKVLPPESEDSQSSKLVWNFQKMDSDYYSQTQNSLRTFVDTKSAGTIHKIQMKNFMCHDNLEVKLNPRINFIIGKNGSGKSAVQTAIAIGMGGKALATNRGSSLKALIKNDKSTCTISIWINNEGETAYKPEVYGHLIKVERAFSQSSGSYKIKDSNDKLVSTEKKELDRIVNHFNIQPENPLCILQQDMARNFLNTSDPKKKYAFYMKASRLGDISRLYNESFCKVQTIKEILDSKFECVGEAFLDVLKMRENLKIMEDAKEKRVKCIELEKEMLWAEVNERTLELRRLQRKVEGESQAIQNLKQQLQDLQESNGEEKLRELELKLEEMDKRIADTHKNLEPSKRKNAEKKETYALSVGKFKEVKECVRSTKVKYESCLAEIEKLVKSAPDLKQKQEQLKAELESQKEELNALKAAEATAKHDAVQLNDTVDMTRQSLQTWDSKLENLRAKKGKISDQIRHLSQSTSNMSIYGEAIVAIVDGIERAFSQRKFLEKPVGPIGRHISVCDPKWAGAVEHFFNKGFLSSFCVDNAKDSAVLSQIIKSACASSNHPPPAIICSKFLPHMHDISGNETGTRKYTNLARALKIDNPVVSNCLIDQMEVETVLLIPTNAEAYNLLDEEHKVPRNCKKAFTLTGDQFIPAPNYKSYSAMRPVGRAMLLQARQEDLIREFKNEVNRLSQEMAQVEREKQNVQVQLGELSTSMRKTEYELKNLKNKKIQVDQRIMQITEEIRDTDNHTNIGFLEVESQELKKKFEDESKKLEEFKSKCEKAKAEFEEARYLYEENRNVIEESNRQKAPIQSEIQRLRSRMQESSSKADLIKHRIKDQSKRVGETESKIEEVRKELASTRENAMQASDAEVNTDRSRNEIEAELKAVRTYLKSLEEKLGGSYETLQNSLQSRQQAFDAVMENLNDLRTLMKKNHEAIKVRRTKQTWLQRVMMSSAKHNFQIALKERNFEGKLEFDTANEALEIKVSRPQHNTQGPTEKRLETSSLSGGEKSYATVCFIMALWHEIELPFHFMDEFDVFMDGINRKVVIDMLLGHAKSINQQFVFLTPLDASSIPEDDNITIHRLAAPRN